ncbi:hypothetical protein E2C01_093370 [Portunus trituberculatus]|uniref:Uncharacterized protein n=1 Tax=Portunus trituberculatus TaxID=210409 RepID=A0A5B7JMJ8_PORTR|nr:hypothetical protein [Portunus trituberculatus]
MSLARHPGTSVKGDEDDRDDSPADPLTPPLPPSAHLKEPHNVFVCAKSCLVTASVIPWTCVKCLPRHAHCTTTTLPLTPTVLPSGDRYI